MTTSLSIRIEENETKVVFEIIAIEKDSVVIKVYGENYLDYLGQLTLRTGDKVIVSKR